jgi:hypothetical protein
MNAMNEPSRPHDTILEWCALDRNPIVGPDRRVESVLIAREFKSRRAGARPPGAAGVI